MRRQSGGGVLWVSWALQGCCSMNSERLWLPTQDKAEQNPSVDGIGKTPALVQEELLLERVSLHQENGPRWITRTPVHSPTLVCL